MVKQVHADEVMVNGLRKALDDAIKTPNGKLADGLRKALNSWTGRPFTRPDPKTGVEWVSSTRSALNPDGTPVPDELRRCVEVTALRL